MNGAEMPHVLTTDQKVRSSNLFGRAIFSLLNFPLQFRGRNPLDALK